jgi:hypothetical protein
MKLRPADAATAVVPYANPTPKPAVCVAMCSVRPAYHFIERSTQRFQSRLAAGRDTERQPKHARRRTADLQNSRLYSENACRLLQAEIVRMSAWCS